MFGENNPTKIICTTKNKKEIDKLRENFATEFLNQSFNPEWKKYSDRFLKETDLHIQGITDIYLNNKTWSDLLKHQYPINSIVIEEPYLLNADYSIKYNLVPILQHILPVKSPKLPIHITIFANKNEYNDTFLSTKGVPLKNALDLIFTNYTLSIYLIKGSNKVDTSVKLHDRHIYTNYFYLTSGNGFSYFKSLKNSVAGIRTELTIDLYTNSNILNIANDSLKELKEIAEGGEEFYTIKNGNLQKSTTIPPENRLFR